MAQRRPFSLNLDEDLVAQFDEIAELRQESRSATIERTLRNGIDDERKFLKVMGSPVTGRVLEKLLSSPRLVELIGTVLNEETTPEEIASAKAKAPVLRQAGKKQRRPKKKGTSN